MFDCALRRPHEDSRPFNVGDHLFLQHEHEPANIEGRAFEVKPPAKLISQRVVRFPDRIRNICAYCDRAPAVAPFKTAPNGRGMKPTSNKTAKA